MIRLTAVTKSFDDGATLAVDHLDLHVESGELLVLLGESGCGKTTSLKMINRLIEPTSGRIEVDGTDAAHTDPIQLRRGIGYVFQGIGLFPHMTVAENIAVVPGLLDWDQQQTDERVSELLALVNLATEGLGERYPNQLSGGQRQRIGLARALAAKPRIMLMDEPLGALDPLTRDDLQREFRRIHDDLSLTTVMVTHDMTEALLMADRIAVMNKGRLAALATPHDLMTAPGDDYTAQLMAAPRRQVDAVEALLENGRGRGAAS